ncbi:hypothetical protein J2847_003437 [Azospirillum agricola]|uniref:hypothetical protein n=1 Tax=Azospirillum agricola TaxID=1720247 RepID=UPI001AE57570|nr:hypothetical protein [Azospirillum agricola]MBP2230134.1 hypothetical protein [Azospirillum agricola]
MTRIRGGGPSIASCRSMNAGKSSSIAGKGAMIAGCRSIPPVVNPSVLLRRRHRRAMVVADTRRHDE